MARKVTWKAAASAASRVLRDWRTGKDSKSAAWSALSQREHTWRSCKSSKAPNLPSPRKRK